MLDNPSTQKNSDSLRLRRPEYRGHRCNAVQLNLQNEEINIYYKSSIN